MFFIWIYVYFMGFNMMWCVKYLIIMNRIRFLYLVCPFSALLQEQMFLSVLQFWSGLALVFLHV